MTSKSQNHSEKLIHGGASMTLFAAQSLNN